jgi:hypothetical protein
MTRTHASAREGQAADPRKAELMYKCWAMRVRGDTYIQIAKALGLSNETASLYAREEAERRAPDIAADRNLEFQTAMAEYRGIIAWHKAKMMTDKATGTEGAIILKARQRIDELLGLDIPVKSADQGRNALLESLGAEAAAAILKMLADRRALRP